MEPKFPMRNTTLCYLEQDNAYLMLHRVTKKNDLNHDKWIGVGGKFEPFESPEECLCPPHGNGAQKTALPHRSRTPGLSGSALWL